MSDLLNQTLWAEAMLGKDAEEFLSGDLGRYMLGRAEEEEAEAIEALAKVSPWRRGRVAQLQAQLWRARSFKTWLAELITGGHQALAQLEEQHTE
jgi:hypothetical protein